MAHVSMILLVASLTVASALVVERSNAAMRPDVAAKSLEKMENTWASQAFVFTACATTGADFNCKEAPKAFATSCKEVASPLFKVATKDNFLEYMTDVCKNMQLGWHQATCQKVGTFVDAEMSASAYENRKSAETRAQKACTGVWSHVVAEQGARAKKAKAKEEEESKKESAQEEKEEKKEAKEAAGVVATVKQNEEEEAKNAKPVSFLQEGVSQAEARRQQEGVAEALRHQAEMDADLEPVSDELTRAPSMSLFEERSETENEHRAENSAQRVYMTQKEASAKAESTIAKHDADQKHLEEWVAGQNAIIASRNALTLRIKADQKKRHDDMTRELNYDMPTASESLELEKQ